MDKLHENLALMPVSSTQEANPDIIHIGEMLKSLRLEKGETLQYIADQLRISAKYLEAIEDHDLAAMPERVYALGFIRSYARYLDADVAHCSAILKGALEQLENPSPRSFNIPDPVTAVPRGWMILGGLAAVALVYSFWRLLSSQDVPPIDLSSETQDISTVAGAPTKEPSLRSEERIPELAHVPPSETETTPPVAAPQPIEKSSVQGQEEQKLSAAPIISGPLALQRDAQGSVNFAIPSHAQLAVTATALSWVEISTKDGQTRVNKNLAAGMKEAFSPSALLYLSTGNAGALYISINGQLHGPFGKDGEVLRHVPLHFHATPASPKQ
jgi:cytoskeleton protein RodZ